jgi:tryptophan synthase beta chain
MKNKIPTRIYLTEFEGANTSGSHKLNSAGPQAYYVKKEGLTSLTMENGVCQ